MAFEWPVFQKRPLGNGQFWSATFQSHDQHHEHFYFRIELFDGDQAGGEFVAQIGSELAGDDWTTPAFAKELESRLFHEAWRTVVVDGQVYRWRLEEDDRNYSTSFSHRGVAYEDIIKISSDDGFAMSFLFPFYDVAVIGWWRDKRYMDPRVAERAVRIARRTGSTTLGAAQIDEAIYGPSRTLADELAAATAALPLSDDDLRESFVRAWLAIGCNNAADRDSQVAVADWIASHADELAAARDKLQQLLEETGDPLDVHSNRSAIAFLMERCERVAVQLGLVTSHVDEALKAIGPYSVRPWGIPPEHWWWRFGRHGARDPRPDPYD